MNNIAAHFDYPKLLREIGFKLRSQKQGELDWRLMNAIDVERLLKEQNLQEVDSMLHYLSEAPVSSLLDIKILDKGIVKYYVMAQYAIQYLLHCRKYLEDNLNQLNVCFAKAQKDALKYKKLSMDCNAELLQLNQKITQMEAIHEVVYPCWHCTKSFVSNDALNIHLLRKHGESAVGIQSKAMAASAPCTQRDKLGDVDLIKTIKLELDIIALKERLKTAEKDIEERCLHVDTPRAMAIVGNITPIVADVGIQSDVFIEAPSNENIDSNQEKEDSELSSRSELKERKAQLTQLQEKIKDIEAWRAAQQLNDNKIECINEIKRQLADLTAALEQTKLQRVDSQTSLTRNLSPTMEDLERILSEKVQEMGKVSVEKLEQAVQHLQLNYQQKLDVLEQQLQQIAAENTQLKQNKQEMRSKNNTHMEVQTDLEPSNSTFTIAKVPEILTIQKINVKNDINANNNQVEVLHFLSSHSSSSSSNSLSNPMDIAPISAKCASLTDISQSLSNVSVNAAEEEQPAQQSNRSSKSANASIKQPLHPRLVRKHVIKMMDKQLSNFGVNPKVKSISNLAMNKCFKELNEHRLKLKQKYPDFYIRRNKLKVCVERVCTGKMPADTEAIVKALLSAPLKKPPLQTVEVHQQAVLQPTKSQTSTPRDALPKEDDEFKQRLERILASPIHEPSGGDIKQVKADVHAMQSNSQTTQPVPMPRKRVMFNTKNDKNDKSDKSEASSSEKELYKSTGRFRAFLA